MGDSVMLSGPGTCHHLMTAIRQIRCGRGSSLQNTFSSVISPTFIARLIKGCRGDVLCKVSSLENHSTFNALTSIFAGLTPLTGGFVLAQ
jgi:hypothetical protein